MRMVDVLNIDYIKPIPEGNNYLGGVRDIGKFTEGFCFKVMTKEPLEPFVMTTENLEPPKGVEVKWVFCLDTPGAKEDLMIKLIKIKLKKQHDLGVYVEIDKETDKFQDMSKTTAGNIFNSNSNILGKQTNSDDGYWILLQDWTQCTLKCGGGLQFQQLMCVPPKNNGKPCEGPAVRTRPCNIQPCPNGKMVEKQILTNLKKTDASTLPVIVKMLPLTNRLDRYEKCVIKEGDAVMTLKKENSINQIPVRVVMNDRTFTAYQDEYLHTMYISFLLKDTVFSRVAGKSTCFVLRNKGGSFAEFCEIDSAKSNEYLEEWDYDFNLFKNQCRSKRILSSALLKRNEEKKLEKEFKEKVEQVKMDIVTEQKQQLIKEAEEEEEVQLTTKIQKAQKTSMLALQKEVKLEELMEKEEEAKEDNETQELVVQVEQEKKKEECLLKAIKEKQIEDQFNLARSHAEEQIKSIAEETKKEIIMKRLQIKKKIEEMRKRNERKKLALRTQILTIRSVVAEKLGQAARVGSLDNCFIPNDNNLELIKKFCDLNFPTNYEKYAECNDTNSFCYICCETEFGDLHLKERDKCYNKCDGRT
jgi:hypothetical protein